MVDPTHGDIWHLMTVTTADDGMEWLILWTFPAGANKTFYTIRPKCRLVTLHKEETRVLKEENGVWWCRYFLVLLTKKNWEGRVAGAAKRSLLPWLRTTVTLQLQQQPFGVNHVISISWSWQLFTRTLLHGESRAPLRMVSQSLSCFCERQHDYTNSYKGNHLVGADFQA